MNMKRVVLQCFMRDLVIKSVQPRTLFPLFYNTGKCVHSHLYYEYIYICKYTQKNIFAAYFCNVFYNVRKCLVSQLKYSVNKAQYWRCAPNWSPSMWFTGITHRTSSNTCRITGAEWTGFHPFHLCQCKTYCLQHYFKCLYCLLLSNHFWAIHCWI